MKRKLLQTMFERKYKIDPALNVPYQEGKIRIFVAECKDFESSYGKSELRRELLKQFEEEINKLLF
jgi:hypothetical protein